MPRKYTKYEKMYEKPGVVEVVRRKEEWWYNPETGGYIWTARPPKGAYRKEPPDMDLEPLATGSDFKNGKGSVFWWVILLGIAVAVLLKFLV